MQRKFMTILVVAILTLLPAAFADPTGGVVEEVGSQETGTGSSAGSVNIEGGNVTAVNISGTQITGRWAGFWGNISAGLQLTDANSNIFYEWTVSNVTGATVYASNGTVSNWGGVVAATEADLPSFLRDDAADNWNATFQQNATFTTQSVSVAQANYTTTWQNGAQGTEFRTYGLLDGDDADLIWAATAADGRPGFEAGGATDYQLLVPADSTVVTYTFYLELP